MPETRSSPHAVPADIHTGAHVGPGSAVLAGDDETPFPPRYWWLKRLGLGAVVLVVLVLIVRWWWGLEAQRRLDAKIAELRGQGQRVLLEDFASEPLPPEENAATLLLEAARKLSTAQASIPLDDLSAHPELVAARPADVQRMLDANAEALALVRQARGRTKTDWGVVLKSPVMATLLPHLAPQRDLAKLVCSQAVLHASEGRSLEAVEALRDGMVVSRAMLQSRSFLLELLVGHGQCVEVCEATETILPQLRPASGTPANVQQSVQPDVRQALRALAAELQDESLTREAWIAAMERERMTIPDFVTACSGAGRRTALGYVTGGGGGVPPVVWGAFQPAFILDAAKSLEYGTQYRMAGLAADYPTAKGMLPALPEHGQTPDWLARWLSTVLLPSLDRVVFLQYRALARRRLAATAIAVCLYELEHGVTLESLDALVPEYLSEIPRDPLAVDGAPIRLARDERGGRLYSVGQDGEDQGGWYDPAPQQQYVHVPGVADDEVFFLDGVRPRPPYQPPASFPAATDPDSLEAEEDQEQVEHEPR